MKKCLSFVIPLSCYYFIDNTVAVIEERSLKKLKFFVKFIGKHLKWCPIFSLALQLCQKWELIAGVFL